MVCLRNICINTLCKGDDDDDDDDDDDIVSYTIYTCTLLLCFRLSVY